MPETLTPWLVLVTSFIGAVTAVGVAGLWLRRQVSSVFTDAVLHAVAPLNAKVECLVAIVERELTSNGGGSIKDQVSATNALTVATDQKLTARTRVIDRKIDGINEANEKQIQRIGMVEVQLSKLREAIGQAE